MNDPGLQLVARLARFEDVELLDATWLRLAEELLYFIRDFQASPAAWDLAASEPDDSILRLTAVFDAFLNSQVAGETTRATSGLVSSEVRANIRGAVEAVVDDEAQSWSDHNGSSTLFAVVVAHALAQAVDDLAHPTFREWFHRDGEVKVQPGFAYPVFPHDPRPALDGHAANSNPESLPSRDLTRLRHLRLGPAQSGIDYFVDFDSWNRLSPLGDGGALTFGIAQPNLTLSEFDLALPDAASTFTNRGPRDPSAQAEQVLRMIEAAGQRGVDVLLFPEYTLNDDARDIVAHHLGALRDRPGLIVAGHGTPSEDGRLQNQGWMALPGKYPLDPHLVATTPKIYPAYFGPRVEEIRRGSSVRVYVGERWTVAVLICRDALDATILSQLAEMNVNLLLVPAMSEKSSSMFDQMGILRTGSQAFGLAAVGPARWMNHEGDPVEHRGRRSEGLVSGPYAGWPQSLLRLPTEATTPGGHERGMWIVDSGGKRVFWSQTAAS